MENNQDLLNDLVKHFNTERIKASAEMMNYYESEYGDDVAVSYTHLTLPTIYSV